MYGFVFSTKGEAWGVRMSVYCNDEECFYFSIRSREKYCKRAGKIDDFDSFFEIPKKMARTILMKYIEQNHGVKDRKKALYSKHQKMIFEEI